MLEREEPEPDRGAERAEHGRDPDRRRSGSRRTRRADRTPAWRAAGTPARTPGGGLLVVEALEERGGDADADRAGRQVVRGVEPPRQSLRHQQQHDADQAAGEMRGLDHAERQPAPRGAPAARAPPAWRPRTAGSTPDRKVSRPKSRGVTCSVSRPSTAVTRCGLRAPLAQLVDHEPDQRDARSGSR